MSKISEIAASVLSNLGCGEVYSDGRDSSTYACASPYHGGKVVAKIYRAPKGRSQDHYLSNLSYQDRNLKFYFNKETRLLEASAGFSAKSIDGFAPEIMAVCKGREPGFLMERRPEKTWHAYFQEGNNRGRKTKEFAGELSKLHSIFGRHFADLYESVSWKDTIGLRPLSVSEERERFIHYLRTIVYRLSEPFRKSLDVAKKRTELLERRAIKRNIDSFVEDTFKTSLSGDFVPELVKKHREIVYGQSNDFFKREIGLKGQMRTLKKLYEEGIVSIVHGDFFPQNVFRMEDPEKVMVCDFAETIAANRHKDLATCLDSMFTQPRYRSEPGLLEALNQYRRDVQERENITLNQEDLLIGMYEERLLSKVRMLAIQCRFTDKELVTWARKLGEFAEREEDDPNLSTDYLKTCFLDPLAKYFDVINSVVGSVIGDLAPPTSEKVLLLKQQADSISRLFSATDVLPHAQTQQSNLRQSITYFLEVGDKEVSPDSPRDK